jgi:hypothetical protein
MVVARIPAFKLTAHGRTPVTAGADVCWRKIMVLSAVLMLVLIMARTVDVHVAEGPANVFQYSHWSYWAIVAP